MSTALIARQPHTEGDNSSLLGFSWHYFDVSA